MAMPLPRRAAVSTACAARGDAGGNLVEKGGEGGSEGASRPQALPLFPLRQLNAEAAARAVRRGLCTGGGGGGGLAALRTAAGREPPTLRFYGWSGAGPARGGEGPEAGPSWVVVGRGCAQPKFPPPRLEGTGLSPDAALSSHLASAGRSSPSGCGGGVWEEGSKLKLLNGKVQEWNTGTSFLRWLSNGLNETTRETWNLVVSLLRVIKDVYFCVFNVTFLFMGYVCNKEIALFTGMLLYLESTNTVNSQVAGKHSH